MNNQTKKTKKIGALDIFIILAVIVCIAVVGLRWFVNSSSDVGEQVQLNDYIISFKVKDIKDTSAQRYFEPGTYFYLKSTNVELGTMREGITIKDAENEYEMPNGEVVVAQNNATGDLYRVDVEASFDAKGRVDNDGRFLLNGNTYIGINKELEIYSKYLAITVIITGITPVK